MTTEASDGETLKQMSTADSDQEADGVEVVFLSPPEEFTPRQTTDQGGSPTLPRRSNRKRKSVTVQQEMSKGVGSGSKKKKSSPDKSMPKVPRTPKGAQSKSPAENAAEVLTDQQHAKTPTNQAGLDIGALLRGMEERLAGKIEATNKAANEAVAMSKETNAALNALEDKVNTGEENMRRVVEEGEEALRRTIEETEERLMMRVSQKVESMVKHQLHEAGFDPSLTVGGLSTMNGGTSFAGASYAAAAASRTLGERAAVSTPIVKKTSTNADPDPVVGRTERREDRFWACRRSLRLWPVKGASADGLRDFLETKLGMNGSVVDDAIGGATILKVKDPRSKLEDEVVVTFESKEIRDAIKAQGHNLAKFKEEAGMRLHIPNYLQKDFKTLMRLAYLMKKTNPDLRRNIKFDEDCCGLFLDMQLKKEGKWVRVRPDEARKAVLDRGASDGPSEIAAEELRSMIGDPEDE